VLGFYLSCQLPRALIALAVEGVLCDGETRLSHSLKFARSPACHARRRGRVPGAAHPRAGEISAGRSTPFPTADLDPHRRSGRRPCGTDFQTLATLAHYLGPSHSRYPIAAAIIHGQIIRRRLGWPLATDRGKELHGRVVDLGQDAESGVDAAPYCVVLLGAVVRAEQYRLSLARQARSVV